MAQSYPGDRYEVLVVDNGGSDATWKDVQFLQRDQGDFNLRYLREEQLGLHNARHAGVRSAKGNILVFADDDATFDRGWLKAYVNAFADHPRMVAAGGPVRPVWEHPPPWWLSEFMGNSTTFPILSLMEPYQEFRLDSNCFFFGVNMAVRRSVFERSGFHPELLGTRTIGDGESGLNGDISRHGGPIGYIPGAIAYHHISASRMTVAYIRKWAWHLGGSQMYQRWQQKERALSLLTREIITIVRTYWRWWLKSYVVRHRLDAAAINAQFDASLGWCKLKYVWWMLSDPEVQAALDMTDFRPLEKSREEQ
jgi:glycosyltransferase involved in cell wall biosynthesis